MHNANGHNVSPRELFALKTDDEEVTKTNRKLSAEELKEWVQKFDSITKWEPLK